MRSEWRIKEMKLELSILRACSFKVNCKLENKKTKVDLRNKNYKIENLGKISKQGTLNSLNTL